MIQRLKNRFLFWYYSKEIKQLINGFTDAKGNARVMTVKDISNLYRLYKWPSNKANRVFALCNRLGIIKDFPRKSYINHQPKTELVYKIANEFLND